jgi:hypothetical protein
MIKMQQFEGFMLKFDFNFMKFTKIFNNNNGNQSNLKRKSNRIANLWIIINLKEIMDRKRKHREILLKSIKIFNNQSNFLDN